MAAPPYVLLSAAGGSYGWMLEALSQQYGGTLESAVLTDQTPASRPFTLAVGSKACEAMIRYTDEEQRTLCLFLPSQTFVELTSGARGQQLLADRRISAIYLDQPLQRQMLLAQMLKPELKTIGTVLGPGSDSQAERFEQAAESLGLTPLIGRLQGSENPVRALTPVIEQSDAFLPLPDSSVFNRASAKWILYLTLKNRIPLIGFSANYANAGAVVALYSDLGQIAQQAVDIINNRVSDAGQLPPPSYPQAFSISINHTAAGNLDMTLPTSSSLVDELKRLERNAR
ncbi:ABC transporter substrate-binding protein [Marinobacterium sp. YM272]|uniref:ABC transporter substrate-binding protein n=1 Tax=Marinobacterium sp. YM272 TaxID=3421654 RepID=UPI003D7FFF16